MDTLEDIKEWRRCNEDIFYGITKDNIDWLISALAAALARAEKAERERDEARGRLKAIRLRVTDYCEEFCGKRECWGCQMAGLVEPDWEWEPTPTGSGEEE